MNKLDRAIEAANLWNEGLTIEKVAEKMQISLGTARAYLSGAKKKGIKLRVKRKEERAKKKFETIAAFGMKG